MPTESCYLEWKKYYRISRIGISFIKTLAFSFSLSCLYYIDSSVAWRPHWNGWVDDICFYMINYCYQLFFSIAI